MQSRDLKQLLRSGEAVYGPFVRLTTPQAVEIFGHAGFDFCIIDMEHGPHSFETAENLIRAAENTGMIPIIRTSFNTPWMILRGLDIGARGIQVPGIGSAEEALSVVRSARYSPRGDRGVCRAVRSAQYSNIPGDRYFPAAAESVVVIVHIEGASGVENLDEIIAVPGLDVVFLGPYDLSQYLGLTGEVEHPKVVALLKGLIERIREKQLAVGIFTDQAEKASYWRDLGVQYISVGIDTRTLYEAASSVVSKLRR